MKKFSDFGIKTEVQNFSGDKIKIDRVLNRQIIVHQYKIENSKHNNGKCLYMQIELDNTKRVLFTGSVVLLDTIQKIPEHNFPFTTTIIRNSEHFEFT
jgi:hypothetical protein